MPSARAAPSPATTKRLGRPPRVTTAQIAEAALEIGLERATVRNVAAHLGMSVPGMYHHVRTREELLAIAAAHGLSELPLPEDHGEPWTTWLTEYARFVYDALVAQPEIIGQIVAGTIDTLRMAQHLERFFTVLANHGFSIDEAYAAYLRLTSAITGAAASEVGHRAMEAGGHARLDDLRRATLALGPETVPHVMELVNATSRPEPDHFDAVRAAITAIEHSR
jgi:AcrR family transcriptional regulator